MASRKWWSGLWGEQVLGLPSCWAVCPPCPAWPCLGVPQGRGTSDNGAALYFTQGETAGRGRVPPRSDPELWGHGAGAGAGARPPGDSTGEGGQVLPRTGGPGARAGEERGLRGWGARVRVGGGGAGRAPLVVEQQHDGVELLARPVVGAQRHDEVVQPVARRLRGDDDQLVLEAVGLGVLVAVVFAALPGGGGRGSGPALAPQIEPPTPRSPCPRAPVHPEPEGQLRGHGEGPQDGGPRPGGFSSAAPPPMGEQTTGPAVGGKCGSPLSPATPRPRVCTQGPLRRRRAPPGTPHRMADSHRPHPVTARPPLPAAVRLSPRQSTSWSQGGGRSRQGREGGVVGTRPLAETRSGLCARTCVSVHIRVVCVCARMCVQGCV